MLSFDRQLRALFSSTPASAFEGYAGKFMEGDCATVQGCFPVLRRECDKTCK
jgi:hypothetical protein